jgi:hypothetical protein
MVDLESNGYFNKEDLLALLRTRQGRRQVRGFYWKAKLREWIIRLFVYLDLEPPAKVEKPKR